MLYIPCVEFQFVFITSNYPLNKMANLISKGVGGGTTLARGANAPLPQMKPCLLTVNTLIPYSRFILQEKISQICWLFMKIFSVKISTINAAELVPPISGTHWQGKSCAIAASHINIYVASKNYFHCVLALHGLLLMLMLSPLISYSPSDIPMPIPSQHCGYGWDLTIHENFLCKNLLSSNS